ncbi:MAG: tRNA (N6-isopentenyl adenosine(37)-C2)-methylthiotransferase MiaB [Bacteroidia bacterium]|nr:tRNA (N6-isopentenyl adenosine(37)-C2)-methylthiotransferase MiaB [Bacteroidia bacterium]
MQDLKYIDESKQGQALVMPQQVNDVEKRKVYIESYGCQMNFGDSEIVASIVHNQGFATTGNIDAADLILLNTCAIRDNAEQRIWNRLKQLNPQKRNNPNLIIGVMGCMAERLKGQLLEDEKLVDIVVGPDAYRDLPNLINQVESGHKAVNVLLSREETYADISPVRLDNNGVSAFLSIMRGCDNMCSFCVVPFTRGRERSRDPESILAEAQKLVADGYREVTLLGQNVDSYLWHGGGLKKDLDADVVQAALAHQLPAAQQKQFITFADLLEMVAKVSPLLRVRFSTSNPRDITDAVLHSMSRYANICKYIHLPVQSGNSRVLEKMNRGYTREDYMKHIESIRNILPGCGISTDIMTGFCTETDAENDDTISLMEWVGYDYAYMFIYSERPGTLAARKYPDDVPADVKQKRLEKIIATQNKLSLQKNKEAIGQVQQVLVEGFSKRSNEHLCGRNDQNKTVVFPKQHYKKGDYVNVMVTDCTAATLLGEAIV